MDSTILEQLGLTKNEVKVYLALLELGSVPAGPLIKRVGMHRAAVYNLLDLLLDKGLISYVIKANRKNFEAHNPERLLEYIESKKKDLDTKEEVLKRILPELQARRKLAKEEQEGTIYKGKKGLKSILEDVLNSKSTFFVFGATGQFKELFGHYFIQFHKKRVERKIPMRIMYRENVRSQQRNKELLNAKIKYLPREFITPSTTYIWDNKVAVIQWSNDPMAFVIRSKEVADSYRSFFEILWNTSVE